MTEPTPKVSGTPDTSAPTASTTDPSPPTTATAPAPGDTTTEAEGHGSGEAAKWRRKLRDAEAERDALRSRVDAHTKADVERAVTELKSTLSDPADLWRDGLVLADLLDDAGNVDAGKLETAVATVVAAHPAWTRPVTRVDLGQGPRGIPTPTTTLGAAIRDAVRGR